jgi:asparagine synthase (glutamine-hydrolysing)
MYVSEADVLRAALDVPDVYDEPFADDSSIPTLLLCRMARQEVTVALSGDGGDELFAGYDRYAIAERWLARARALPAAARMVSAGALAAVVQPLAARFGSLRTERRFELLRRLLREADAERFNETIMSQVFGPGRLVAGGADRDGSAFGAHGLGLSSPIDRMTFMDLGTYLIDDILMKVDRASMAASLEVRCPLLDYRVIEQSWRFPAPAKTDGSRHKLPLRRVLYRHVPQALVDRPKMGFGSPVDVWLQKELRDWAEALMSREALAAHGLLDVAACRKLWEDFAIRGRGWHRAIWHVLMFQAWYASMRRATATPTAALATAS